MLLLLVLGLTVCAGIVYLVESAFFSGGMRAVYMGSNLKQQEATLHHIVESFFEHLDSTQSYRLIEPGAGIGHVARMLSRAYLWKSVSAIELRPTVYAVGMVLAALKGGRVRYYRKNLFDVSYESPSLIYCYLTTPIINRLYAEGRFKGNLVVCLTFVLDGVRTTRQYPLPGWQKQITVYDFR